MERAEAIEVVKKNWPDSRYTLLREALETLIPELRESEDERMRQLIYSSIKNDMPIASPKNKELALAWLEKQKDASKAIEAVDRIDKYIDEHLANAHDMKDSDPDKKYYRGWDDALGKMSGILQDVYSGEKQKEQPQEELVYRLNGLMQEYIKEGKDDAEKEHRFKCYQLFWDALEDADFFEQKEQKPAEWNPTNEDVILFNKAVTTNTTLTSDERAKLDIIRMKFKHRPVIKQQEQKPVQTAKDAWKEMRLEVYAQASGNRHEPNYSDDSTKMFSLCDIDEIFEKIGNYSVEQKPVWNEEDERMLRRCIKSIESSKNFAETQTFKEAKDKEKEWLISLLERFSLQPKQEWSEEDEHIRHQLIVFCEKCMQQDSEAKRCATWLKSLCPPFKDREMKLKILKYLSTRCSSLEFEEVEDYLNNLRPQPKQEVPADTEVLIAKLVNLLKSYRIGEVTATGLANRIADTYGTQRYLDGLCDGKKDKWKPSEDEERLISTSISFIKDFADKGYENAVECIDWLKSKLNGNLEVKEEPEYYQHFDPDC